MYERGKILYSLNYVYVAKLRINCSLYMLVVLLKWGGGVRPPLTGTFEVRYFEVGGHGKSLAFPRSTFYSHLTLSRKV